MRAVVASFQSVDCFTVILAISGQALNDTPSRALEDGLLEVNQFLNIR